MKDDPVFTKPRNMGAAALRQAETRPCLIIADDPEEPGPSEYSYASFLADMEKIFPRSLYNPEYVRMSDEMRKWLRSLVQEEEAK